jgi:CubicO group peptidase (beta-lactamase class C family)
VSARLEVDVRPGLEPALFRAMEAGASVLRPALEEGFPPAAAAALVDARGIAAEAWGGWACLDPERVALARGTRFDLASLTKVMISVSLVLRMRDEHRWSLADPVRRWLPAFPREDLTLRHCLTHTSGLPSHRPLYLLPRPRRIRRTVYDEARRAGPPGEVVYSDLNFMLLGWALEALSGTGLRRLAREALLDPLGMSATDYRPPARLRRMTAATEVGGDQRPAPEAIWGEVHDGNAWAMGGVAGHAGLFAPVSDVAGFVSALLRPGRHPVLSAASIAEMTSRQAGRSPDVRGLGWRLEPGEWGDWPEGTFWHTGFTGTSILVAPALAMGVVLLTNAVHPRRRLDRQATLRRDFHRALIRELGTRG